MYEKNVVSFSLYGDLKIFTAGMVENAKLAKEIYPNWEVRVYHSSDVPRKILESLSALGCVLKECHMGPNTDGMFWRFLPMCDDSVRRFISRDADCRLSWREKAAVDEWMASGKAFHVMRDSPGLFARIPGGTFGMDNLLMKDVLKEPIGFDYNKEVYRFQDQKFLGEQIWPLVKDGNHIAHDTFDLVKTGNEVHFPPHRPMKYGTYVGECIDENNQVIDWYKKSREEAKDNIFTFYADTPTKAQMAMEYIPIISKLSDEVGILWRLCVYYDDAVGEENLQKLRDAGCLTIPNYMAVKSWHTDGYHTEFLRYQSIEANTVRRLISLEETGYTPVFSVDMIKKWMKSEKPVAISIQNGIFSIGIDTVKFRDCTLLKGIDANVIVLARMWEQNFRHKGVDAFIAMWMTHNIPSQIEVVY